MRDLLRLAYRQAIHSPDPSTQNGAILALRDGTPILNTGACNAPPDGVAGRWRRPEKYLWTEHAERASIFAAARYGIRTQGLTMGCAWAACADCARAIVGAGIARLIRHPYEDERWRESVEVGDAILSEGGVEVIDFHGRFPDVVPIRRGGVLWQP